MSSSQKYKIKWKPKPAEIGGKSVSPVAGVQPRSAASDSTNSTAPLVDMKGVKYKNANEVNIKAARDLVSTDHDSSKVNHQPHSSGMSVKRIAKSKSVIDFVPRDDTYEQPFVKIIKLSSDDCKTCDPFACENQGKGWKFNQIRGDSNFMHDGKYCCGKCGIGLTNVRGMVKHPHICNCGDVETKEGYVHVLTKAHMKEQESDKEFTNLFNPIVISKPSQFPSSMSPTIAVRDEPIDDPEQDHYFPELTQIDPMPEQPNDVGVSRSPKANARLPPHLRPRAIEPPMLERRGKFNMREFDKARRKVVLSTSVLEDTASVLTGHLLADQEIKFLCTEVLTAHQASVRQDEIVVDCNVDRRVAQDRTVPMLKSDLSIIHLTAEKHGINLSLFSKPLAHIGFTAAKSLYKAAGFEYTQQGMFNLVGNTIKSASVSLGISFADSTVDKASAFVSDWVLDHDEVSLYYVPHLLSCLIKNTSHLTRWEDARDYALSDIKRHVSLNIPAELIKECFEGTMKAFECVFKTISKNG